MILLVAAGIGWLVVRRARGPEVQVVRASRREVIETLVASGRILPPSRASLASPVLASVRAVRAVEGDRVSQGQLLIELDDTDARAAVERAEASVALARARIGQIRSTSSRVAASELARAEAALARAEDDLRRQEQLRSSGAVTDAQLQAARLAREQALAARESARFTSEG
ncbi:MAG: biotin/lipoyl-binding protein, partial [Sandaracinaceae bacterium]|nr:biotin/lipoyl-binding protein [Sandaracinaceae bacterium]